MEICFMKQIYSVLEHTVDTVSFFTMKADNFFSMNLSYTAELQ